MIFVFVVTYCDLKIDVYLVSRGTDKFPALKQCDPLFGDPTVL